MPRTEHHEHPALDLVGGKDVQEKRAKREIANMNERKRMQNINSGFHSLRALLPNRHDGEKLSKAAILSHTATYVYQMEQEMSKLMAQNSELKRLVGGSTAPAANAPEWVKRLATQPPDCPSCKRRKFEDSNQNMELSPDGDGSSTESSSEQETSVTKPRARKPNSKVNQQAALRKQVTRLEKQLEEERRIRNLLEEELNYQHKSLGQNGNRQLYNASIDNTGMIEEVEIAGESIEIEMHSCPVSPPDMLHMDQTAANGTGGSVIQLANSHSTGISSPLELTTHSKLIEQRVQTSKNAIALPIDVPFVAPREVTPEADDTTTAIKSEIGAASVTTSINSNNNSSPVMVLVDNSGNFLHFLDPCKIQTTSSGMTSAPSSVIVANNSASQLLQLVSSASINSSGITNNAKQSSPAATRLSSLVSSPKNGSIMSIGDIKQEPSDNVSEEGAKTSRQNLNTIVEAIRHLEGDLFNEQLRQLPHMYRLP